MRVSTSMMYENSVRNITNASAAVSEETQRLSSGKQRLSPSDDPFGAYESLVLSSSKSMYDTSSKIAQQMSDGMEIRQGFLQDMRNTLSDIKELVIQAGNGSLSMQDLGAVAEKLGSLKETLRGTANSKMPEGDFAFSGFQNIIPFPSASAPAGYSGDSGNDTMTFNQNVSVQTRVPGNAVFGNNDIIGALDSFVSSLRTGDSSGVAATLSTVESSMSSVNNTISDLAARQNTLQSVSDLSQKESLALSSRISHNDDADMPSVISRLTQHKAIYDASLKAFSMISSGNLFSIL